MGRGVEQVAMVALEPGDLPSVLTVPRSPEWFWMDHFPPFGGVDFFIDFTRMLTCL